MLPGKWPSIELNVRKGFMQNPEFWDKSFVVVVVVII